MSQNTRKLLEAVETWPEEDQEELIQAAREIEARRSGVYRLSDEEQVAIEEGLAEANRGEFVSDEEMAALWQRCGL